MKNLDFIKYSACTVRQNETLDSGACCGWLCSTDGWIISAGHLFVSDGEIYDEKMSNVEPRFAYVQFPSSEPFKVRLSYAEKNNMQGIDFAVLLSEKRLDIHPLLVNGSSKAWTGKVHIVGIDHIASGFVTGSDGEIESSMLHLNSGNEIFIQIRAENAVQEGYSGGPVFSYNANAVIGIQVMASTSGLHPGERPHAVAGQRIIRAMPLSAMIERFPPLKSHLLLLERPFSSADLLDMLEQYRISYDQSGHKYFDNTSIEELILPTIREGRMTSSETHDLNQPVLDAVKMSKDHNCYILGEQGGCGKTVTLFKLFSSWLRESHRINMKQRIPIYVGLKNLPFPEQNGYGEELSIPMYLRNIFFAISDYSSGDQLLRDLSQELKSPSMRGTKYVLLLDGLNEVSLSHRTAVIEEILYWSRLEHIQVIVTSRYKEDRLVEDDAIDTSYDSFEYLHNMRHKQEDGLFKFLIIQKLKDEVVSSYLSEHEVSASVIQEAMNNKRLLEILCIPMYLTIFVGLYLSCPNKRLEDICTKGQLLYESFGVKRDNFRKGVSQREKLNKRPRNRQMTQEEEWDRERKLFVLDIILPYIAFHVAVSKEHPMSIDANELYALINALFSPQSFMIQRAELFSRNNAYQEIKKFARWNKTLTDGYSGGIDPADWIVRFIVEELHMMRSVVTDWYVGAEGTDVWGTDICVYEFIHENLRDYFAAMHIREDIACFIRHEIDSNISLANSNIPHPILEFLGDLCKEHEFKPYYDEQSGRWIISGPDHMGNLSYIELALNRMRGKHELTFQNMVANLIEVMKYSRKNDLSGVDLHDLDLSKSWLGGIRFSRVSGIQLLAANFDGATIQRFNLIRNGHDRPVICAYRDIFDHHLIYSTDTSGRIIRWDTETNAGIDFCDLDMNVRYMLPSPDGKYLFVASEHIIYSVRLCDALVNRVYATKGFIRSIRVSECGISFQLDSNPVLWTELLLDQTESVISVKRDEMKDDLWLCAYSCVSCDNSWVITGGTSRSHRVQVFHKNKDGTWNRNPVQTVSLSYGHHMTGIALSKNESKVLICVQNCLYEYSILEKKLHTETFRLYNPAGFGFANYFYDNDGMQAGILLGIGTELIVLDNDYQVVKSLRGGNSDCYLAFPFQINRSAYIHKGKYYLTRQSGMDRDVFEKYHLYSGTEMQEFDADTNICSRVFSLKSRMQLGYCVTDLELCMIGRNGYCKPLQGTLSNRVERELSVSVDYAEMKGSASFTIQRIGKNVTIYDRYTDEKDVFQVYNGLLIQGCSMKNIEGEMGNPDNLEILRRYGANL